MKVLINSCHYLELAFKSLTNNAVSSDSIDELFVNLQNWVIREGLTCC